MWYWCAFFDAPIAFKWDGRGQFSVRINGPGEVRTQGQTNRLSQQNSDRRLGSVILGDAESAGPSSDPNPFGWMNTVFF
jgi:hypothetical protein